MNANMTEEMMAATEYGSTTEHDSITEHGSMAEQGATAARWVFCDLDGTLLRGDTLLLFLLHSVRSGWLSAARLAYIVGVVAASRAGLVGRDRLRQVTYDVLFDGREVPREAIARFIERLLASGERWHPEVLRVLREESAAGATLVMITNSFDFLAEPIARHFGFHRVHSVRAPIQDNRFSRGAMQALVGERKARIVSEALAAGAVATGLGNTSDDIDFLKLCARSYMVTRRARYKALASKLGWTVLMS